MYNNPLNMKELNSYCRMRINTHSCIINMFSKDFEMLESLYERQKFQCNQKLLKNAC
jgi:hypothetical protein